MSGLHEGSRGVTEPIGYAMVIVRQKLFYQGFFVNDTPILRQQARKIAAVTDTLPEEARLPALHAATVDRCLNRRLLQIPIYLYEIYRRTMTPYFVISAAIDDGGTYTTFEKFSFPGVEEARNNFKSRPEVMYIDLLLAMRGIQKDQS